MYECVTGKALNRSLLLKMQHVVKSLVSETEKWLHELLL